MLTDLSSERIVKALQKAGFRIVKQGKHIGMSNGVRRVIIPHHKRVNPYTLKSIIIDAGLTEEQFKKLL